MTILRVKKDEKYFAASNEAFNDMRLSWEARGLMGYLLSKPNDWKIRMTDLEKKGPAGNYKLRRMLAELRKYGYMSRIRTVKPDKTFDWLTLVYESPSQNPRPSSKVIKASGGFSTSGSSTSGKLPDIVSTDLLNTETTGDLQEVIDSANRKVDAYLSMAQAPGLKRTVRVDGILSYLGGRLRVNTETKRWREFAKFVDDRQQEGEKLEVFIEWLTSKKDFKLEFWPPQRMREFWPQAFSEDEAIEKTRLL